jgi:prepilin-type N-terminal cleavage/methylation domain-containing protein
MSPRAYTLLEVVLATAILAVVLLGAQSAVVIAARAIPSGTSGPSALVAASTALGTLADDLPVAKSIDTMTATDIQFVVPDRTGDAVDDTIRYVWSGVAGDPLKRIVNGGAAQVVGAGVQDFALAYDTAQAPLPATWSDGAETTLFSYTATTGLKNGAVRSDRWWAQYFMPSLPANASAWSVTRITFSARSKGGNQGQANAQLRLDVAGNPGGQVVGETAIFESAMSGSYAPLQANFGYVSGLTPGSGLWFVFQWVADTDAFELEYQTATGTGAAAPVKQSVDSGTSWSTIASSELLLTVYGKARAEDPTQYKTVVTGVRCRLRTGATDATSLTQSWRILNQPVAH